jgi:hypothetical protein
MVRDCEKWHSTHRRLMTTNIQQYLSLKLVNRLNLGLTVPTN